MPVIPHLLIATLMLFQGQAGARQKPAGGDAPTIAVHEPTPFEKFADKLSLDENTQLPETGKIFTAAAGEAAPVGRELLQLRLRLLDLDGKADEAAPVITAYTAAAGKLAAIDVRAFQKVFALLEKGQQSKSADAFVMMAGLLDVSTPRAGAPGGGRRGGSAAPLTRMELLTSLFNLDGNQKKQVKSILDADYKAAAAARDQWTKTRAAVGTAIQNGKPAPEIDQAVAAYAADAATVAVAEMKSVAKIVALLTPEQKGNTAAIQTTVFAIRGAFSAKKWDVAPD